jgi:hypothetical protein
MMRAANKEFTMTSRFWKWNACALLAVFFGLALVAARSSGQFPGEPGDTADRPQSEPAANPGPPPKNPTDPKAELKRLSPKYDVWMDLKNKQVIMEGQVCLTNGLLELFACIKGTKEHESVVSVNTKAFVVHAALLAIGAKPGSPVKFDPQYTAATGPKVEILVFWTDENGKQHKTRAQDWVRDIKKKQAMEYPWVFAGSGFYVDEETKHQYYLADGGDFICVSNFPGAMLDLPIESTSDNADLMFEAFTENIPPRGTKVTLVLIPEIDKKPAGDAKQSKTPPAEKSGK